MTNNACIELMNEFLVARVSRVDGNLVYLGRPGKDMALIERTYCHYRIGERSYSEFFEDDAPSDFQVTGISADGCSVRSRVKTWHVEVERLIELPVDSPLIAISVRINGLARGETQFQVGFPHVAFGPGFLNAFEDEEDL